MWLLIPSERAVGYAPAGIDVGASGMSSPSNEEVVRRYMEAHRVHDYETVGRCGIGLGPGVAAARRAVRGHANDQAIMDNWPGGLPSGVEIHLTGSEDRWVATPANTVHRVVGSGDTWWADGTAAIPTARPGSSPHC